jgi:ferredoxin
MRVRVNLDKCIGSGNCLSADAVFDQGDDGLVILLTDRPGADLHEAVGEAALLCPANAILIEED